MHVLNHNAPALLLEKSRSLGERYHSWRCIHISLSDLRGQYSGTVLRHFVIEAIIDILENNDGTIYVCDDGDLFILFQGALKPVLARLGSHIDGILPSRLEEQPEDPLFTIFDLSRHWPLFLRLCAAKARQAAQERLTPKVQFREMGHYQRQPQD